MKKVSQASSWWRRVAELPVKCRQVQEVTYHRNSGGKTYLLLPAAGIKPTRSCFGVQVHNPRSSCHRIKIDGDQKGGYGIGRPRSGGRFVDLLIISNKDFRLKSQYATTKSQTTQLIMFKICGTHKPARSEKQLFCLNCISMRILIIHVIDRWS